MSTRISQHIEQIFSEAATLRSEDREAYLRQACAGDSHLHSAVEALLAAAAVSEDYFSDLSNRLSVTWGAITRRKS